MLAWETVSFDEKSRWLLMKASLYIGSDRFGNGAIMALEAHIQPDIAPPPEARIHRDSLSD